MNEKQFNGLVEIAQQWSDFSRDMNGWESAEYQDPKILVWCYFAEGSNHKAVKFTLKNESYGAQVSFFSQIRLEDVSLKTIKHVRHIIKLATDFLNEQKKYHEKVSAAELEEKRLSKIKALEERLNELKVNHANI